MLLTPFEDIDISTKKGGQAFLKTAHVCIPLEWECSMEHIGYAEYAATVGTEMLREMSKPKQIYFHARFTHPSMGLNEPDGYCFLFRLEDQSELFLIISDSGAILTAPEPPFEIIAGKSKEETEKALADFRARNREELNPMRATAKVPVYIPKHDRPAREVAERMAANTVGKVRRSQDNRYNRRRHGKSYPSGGLFYWAKIIAGIAVIVGFLAFQIYPALVDCNISDDSRQRILINLLKDGERWFCSMTMRPAGERQGDESSRRPGYPDRPGDWRASLASAREQK